MGFTHDGHLGEGGLCVGSFGGGNFASWAKQPSVWSHRFVFEVTWKGLNGDRHSHLVYHGPENYSQPNLGVANHLLSLTICGKRISGIWFVIPIWWAIWLNWLQKYLEWRKWMIMTLRNFIEYLARILHLQKWHPHSKNGYCGILKRIWWNKNLPSEQEKCSKLASSSHVKSIKQWRNETT